MKKDKFIPVCEPFLNGNEKKYINDALETGWISSSGKYVKAFEEKFAEYCDCKYGVSTVNGTTALHLALQSLNIGEGDEVIIPTFTMIATAFAVTYTGAKPVFVDADKNTWNINVSNIEKKITTKTKAILVVHLFGLMCEMDKIQDIAKKHNLFIVEDAAEAHGAEYNKIRAGAYSDIASFSFFANKNLTTGEGGMVVTNNEQFFNSAKYYKNLCFPLDGNRNYTHNDIGYNYRMSNLHAAIGLAQVEKADEYTQLRIKNNNLYRDFLKDTHGISFQQNSSNSLNVCWMNAIVIDPQLYGRTRDELIKHLKNNGIDSRLLFNGMHNQQSLQNFGCDCSDSYPISDWLTNNGLYLPSASNLSQSDIEYICEKIKQFHKP